MKNKTPDFAYHMTKFFTEYLPIQRNLSPNSIATYRDTFRLLLLFTIRKTYKTKFADIRYA